MGTAAMPGSNLRSRRRSSRGLTLIETLVSLGILMIVFALFFSILHSIERVSFSRNRRGIEVDAQRALQRISDDLICASPLTESNAPIFSIALDEDSAEYSSSSLRFALYDRFSEKGMATRWPPQVLAYTLEESAALPGELICRRRALRGPGSGTTGTLERVLAPILQFRVRALAEDGWTDEWGRDAEGLPQALELSMIYPVGSGIGSNKMLLAIPAGNVTTSRVERGSTEMY